MKRGLIGIVIMLMVVIAGCGGYYDGEAPAVIPMESASPFAPPVTTPAAQEEAEPADLSSSFDEIKILVDQIEAQGGAVSYPPAWLEVLTNPNDERVDLVNMAEYDPRIILDIRYATTNNFMGERLYPSAQGYLQRPVAAALSKVADRLEQMNLKLVLLDAYRPYGVTVAMWERFGEESPDYVADPAYGSRHNRGSAVDVTIADAEGDIKVMPSEFDEFTERANRDFRSPIVAARRNRAVLDAVMEAEGFVGYAYEWWHFDYYLWQSFPLLDVSFNELNATPSEEAGAE